MFNPWKKILKNKYNLWFSEFEDINDELNEIDTQIESINQQIEYLQYERESLLKRRDECRRKQKISTEKSSSHGNQLAEIQANWKSQGIFKIASFSQNHKIESMISFK